MGFSKVEVIKQYISTIIPSCEIEVVESLYTKELSEKLLDGNPDFIVDCIDNTETKSDLICYCLEKNLKIVSSMGSGGKIDFTRIWFGSIWNTTEDELSKAIWWILIKKGINRDTHSEQIKCIYSMEKSSRKLMPLGEHQKGHTEDFRVFDKFRLWTVPVLGTLPAIFGNCLATYILSEIAKEPFEPYFQNEFEVKDLSKYTTNLRNNEIKFAKKNKKEIGEVNIDNKDIRFLFEDIYGWQDVFDVIH